MSRHPRHFLDIGDFDRATLHGMISASQAMKAARRDLPRGAVEPDKPLAGRMLGLIFEKPSTRTRVSFDVAMHQLGGAAISLSAAEMQLGRGESIADTARVLSRYVDGIMIRTSGHDKLQELARHATVPVINGLTDASHPCQVMADLMTLEEARGDLSRQVVAWSGDSFNVTTSWVEAAARFGFELRIASPKALQPRSEVIAWARREDARVTITEDPLEAVRGADCVLTDTWTSMNVEDSGNRHNLLRPYQVNAELMAAAKADALFMHCLPAHRGEEVTDEVIDGPNSVVFDEAENRLHIQKGILAWCMGNP
ncbi:MAG: ornithine carbamoyltransferase [Hyphomicrobiales bacterium]